MSERIGAHDLVELVLDPGSHESWDEPIDVSDYSPEYRAAVEKAMQRSGTDESVIRAETKSRPLT